MKMVLDPGCYPLRKAHDADAGYDLSSPVSLVVPARDSAWIDTGVHIQLPERTAGLIRPRSGMCVKHGILCDGVVDPGYTGSIVVRLFNLSGFDYPVQAGDRIAQLVIVPAVAVPLEPVDALPDTPRGTGGFGSSGR